jgi:hypothetical protein
MGEKLSLDETVESTIMLIHPGGRPTVEWHMVLAPSDNSLSVNAITTGHLNVCHIRSFVHVIPR